MSSRINFSDEVGLKTPSSISEKNFSFLPDGKLRRAALAASSALTLWTQAQSYYKAQMAKREWSVSVESDDVLYGDLLAWITERVPQNEHKSLRALTTRRFEKQLFLPEDSPDKKSRIDCDSSPLKVVFNSSAAQHITINGHKIRVEHAAGDVRNVYGNEVSYTKFESLKLIARSEADKLKLIARSEAGKNVILDVLDSLARARQCTLAPPRFFMANRYGNWNSRSDLPLRQLDTVILAKGQKERIVEDIEKFFSLEDLYGQIGAPWHRGYLFHGPPGTGKTSLAKALASHFNMDVFYAPLADFSADSSLLTLVNDVSPRSILLLEDIDTLLAMQDRETVDTDGQGVSLSGILNALDGITTPHGLITIMTTNRREVLDDAVVRPGRVDLEEYIGLATQDQVERMFNSVYPESAFSLDAADLAYNPVTPAEVMDVFKRCPGDPIEASKELKNIIRAANAADAENQVGFTR